MENKDDRIIQIEDKMLSVVQLLDQENEDALTLCNISNEQFIHRSSMIRHFAENGRTIVEQIRRREKII